MPIVSLAEWDAFIHEHPGSHILQTGQWGELKSNFGWETHRLIHDINSGLESAQFGAQILFRPFLSGWSVGYIPKGPVGGPGINFFENRCKNFWGEIDQISRNRRTAFLIVEPDDKPDKGSNTNKKQDGENVVPDGFQPGLLNVQPKQSIIININRSDEEIMGAMKQKTRYNIRLAEKQEVLVTTGDDLGSFYSLMVQTGDRDGFGVHSERYYRQAYELFHPSLKCELFFARYMDELIGAIMVFANDSRAWYFYGASSNAHRNRMPNYLLQWRAIQWAREHGCLYYDLWGIPDESMEKLESEFPDRSDGLWGVYRFKRGFGGQIQRSSGPWDRVYSPVLYRLFRYYTRLRRLSLS